MADDADVTVTGSRSDGTGDYSRSATNRYPTKSAGGGRGGGGRRAPAKKDEQELAEIIVTGNRLSDAPLQSTGTTITLPSGDELQIGNPRGVSAFGQALTPPFNTGYLPGLDRPPSLGAPSGDAFAGPEPKTLPEVTVTGKKPPSQNTRPLTPGAFGSLIGGLYGWAFWFLTVPRLANQGERSRTDAALRERIADAERVLSELEPIVPSVARLPESLPTVTVRAKKLSGNPAVARTRGVFTAPSSGTLRAGRVGFLPTPNSFLYPAPQRTKKHFPISAEVTFGTNPRSLVDPITGQRPRVAPRPGTRVSAPPRGTPLVPGLPGVGVVTPIPTVAPTPGTLTQFQPGRVNDCTCTKTAQRRKKRSPRRECWKGTYVESALGLSKTRRERVPC